MKNYTLPDALALVLKEKNLSVRSNTRIYDAYIVGRILDAVYACNLSETPLKKVSRSDIQNMVAALDSEDIFANLKDTTKKKIIKFLKSSFEWFYQNKLINSNPMAGFRFRRVSVSETQPFTAEEAKRLLSYDPITFEDYRDQSLWHLMMDTGIRRDEAANLKPADLYGNRIHICKAKGGKERTLSFGEQTSKLLHTYIKNYRPQNSEYLFVTKNGSQLKPRQIHKRLVQWAEKAGVRHPHPHRFRATFATRFVMQGGDLVKLQALLGHATIDMSRRYVKLARAEEARLINATSSIVDALVENELSPSPTSMVATAPTLPVDVLPSTPISSPDAATLQQFVTMMGGVMGMAAAMFQMMNQGKSSPPEALTNFLSAGEGK